MSNTTTNPKAGSKTVIIVTRNNFGKPVVTAIIPALWVYGPAGTLVKVAVR